MQKQKISKSFLQEIFNMLGNEKMSLLMKEYLNKVLIMIMTMISQQNEYL